MHRPRAAVSTEHVRVPADELVRDMSGTDFYYEPQVRLGEELSSITPIAGPKRSFFGNSGTEAIEACIKLSRYASGRQNIIAFLGGFHGRSMGSLALTASKAIQRRGFAPFMEWNLRAGGRGGKYAERHRRARPCTYSHGRPRPLPS